ncbi:MAG: hypothetical protein JNK60_04665, partial [Acidobacteria bacterium]|nr:hypothetical protein [Acidobacteriota bacterium]
MGKHEDSAEKVIDAFLERDLTADAAAGRLAPAFQLDDAVSRAIEVLDSGRHLVVTGDAGVGKTALVHELARRTHLGRGPTALAGKRVLQLSLRQRVSMLKDPDTLRPEMQKLLHALVEQKSSVVPFFRDFHLAYRFDLESQIQTLAYRLNAPVLGEGPRATIAALFEGTPELDSQFVVLPLQEVSLSSMLPLLEEWRGHEEERSGRRFSPDALEEALHLTHRFLPRGTFPRKALDLLDSVLTGSGAKGLIEGADVRARFTRLHRVPPLLVDPALPLHLDALEDDFASRVLGQQEAVRVVVRMMGLIKAGLSDLRRPFGVFLFVGPTGVGKTHLA